jgi:hypothetical protein
MNTRQYVVIGDYTSRVFTSRVAAETWMEQQSNVQGGDWYVQERLSYE